MKTTQYPRPGHTYTLQQIEKELYLRDSPSLGFHAPIGRSVIQNSHMTVDDLLGVPGWSDTLWEYVRETEEWVPVFRYAGDTAVLADLLHLEVDLDPYPDGPTPTYWAVPKAFPRTQYYELSADGLTFESPAELREPWPGKSKKHAVSEFYPHAVSLIETWKANGGCAVFSWFI